MIERLLLAVLLIALGYGLFHYYRRQQLRAVSALDPLLAALDLNMPTIVYFTTPQCVVCKTRQQPALYRLQAQLAGHLRIISVDASEQPEVAQRWGVQTAPTTFVMNAAGQAIAVNYGVADENTLRKQLAIA